MGSPPLMRGFGDLPWEISKIGSPESAFPCFFRAIFSNFAGSFFFYHFQEVAGSKTAGATFFFWGLFSPVR